MNPTELTYWNQPVPRDREHAAYIREALREAAREHQQPQRSLADYIVEKAKGGEQAAPATAATPSAAISSEWQNALRTLRWETWHWPP